jgi:hypothetical protein
MKETFAGVVAVKEMLWSKDCFWVKMAGFLDGVEKPKTCSDLQHVWCSNCRAPVALVEHWDSCGVLLIKLVAGQAPRVPQVSGPATPLPHPILIKSQPSSSAANPSGPQQGHGPVPLLRQQLEYYLLIVIC